jgi:hypothetical protein
MIGCGLGEGLEPALQGLVTFLIDSSQTVQLFSSLAVCDTIAELVGGPMTARLLEIGRRPGHASDGICFLSSAVCYFQAFSNHFRTAHAQQGIFCMLAIYSLRINPGRLLGPL